MFIGRDYEMETLNRFYEEDKFHFIPIYGRRRVGKTRLIQEFISDKPHIMIKAVPGNEAINLSMLNEAVSGDTEPIRLDHILWKAEQKSEGKRLIIVIDEYPNLVEDAPHNGGLINNFIEAVKDSSKLFLILCGSSMNIMESEVLGKKSPLYGRRTGQIRVKPFDFRTSTMMLKGFSREDMISIYGLVGGIPYYLEQFDPSMSLRENVRLKYVDPSSVLASEPELMFLTEFRKPATYFSVIHAISRNRRTPGEIAKTLGMEPSAVSHILEKLILLDFVRKDEPFGVKKTKDIRYVVKDRLLSSYFKFIYPDYMEVDRYRIEEAVDEIMMHLNEYLGHVFEDICHEYVRYRGYHNVGRWWKDAEELDVVATNKNEVLFAECRYRNEMTDADLIHVLKERSEMVGIKGLTPRYALFSRSEYTRVARMRAEADNVELLTMDDIFEFDQ